MKEVPRLVTKRKKALDFSGEPPKTLEAFPFYNFNLDEDQLEFANAIWNPEKLIVFCNSPSGTGKTQVAMGVANMLVRYGFYDGIVGVVSPCEESRQGFLPGGIAQKSAVYFEPFYQSMLECNMNPETDISDEDMINEKNGTAFVRLITHTFTRGTSFQNKVIILDEFQNFAFKDAKKMLTRCSDNNKIIVIGHDGQCDLEDKNQSGFIPYMEHYQNDSRCAVCELKTNHRGWVSSHADKLKLSD